MKNTTSDDYLGIIKAEMMAECLITIDRGFIKEIVLRAGGKVANIDNIIQLKKLMMICSTLKFRPHKILVKTIGEWSVRF